jgi:hypothetical protein
MTRRKIEERHIRSLTKVSSGTSYAVTIPMEYIRKLKWRGRQIILMPGMTPINRIFTGFVQENLLKSGSRKLKP